MKNAQNRQARPTGAAFLLAAACGYGLWATSPVFVYGTPKLIPALCALGLLVFGLQSAAALTNSLAANLQWRAATQPKGLYGNGEILSSPKHIRKISINPKKGGIFVGVAPNTRFPVVMESPQNFCAIMPSRSGKLATICVTSMFLLACSSEKPSFYVVDYKPEYFAVLSKMFKKLGYETAMLDPSDPDGGSINPLDRFTREFHEGNLRNVFDDIREFFDSANPSPAGQAADGGFWERSGIDLLTFASACLTTIKGYAANLPDVATLAASKTELRVAAAIVLGRNIYDGKPIDGGPLDLTQSDWSANHASSDVADFQQQLRDEAEWIWEITGADDTRQFDSFKANAKDIIRPFSPGGTLAPIIRTTTMDLASGKDGKPKFYCFRFDATKKKTYTAWFQVLFWLTNKALREHPNRDRKCIIVADEFSNYRFPDLTEHLQTNAGYGIYGWFFAQGLGALFDPKDGKYTKETVRTLMSECPLKVFGPGIDDMDTLAEIERLNGEVSVMTADFRKPTQPGEKISGSVREQGVKVRPAAEIRKTRTALVYQKFCPAIEVELVPYAAIDPVRKAVSPNPQHGNKPWLLPVKLRL